MLNETAVFPLWGFYPLTSFVFITINLIVDILYSILDPRVRIQDARA